MLTATYALCCVILGGLTSARHVHVLTASPQAVHVGVVPKLLEAVKLFFNLQRNMTYDGSALNGTCTHDCLAQMDSTPGPQVAEAEALPRSAVLRLISRVFDAGPKLNDSMLDDQAIQTLLDASFKDGRSDGAGQKPVRRVHSKILEVLAASNGQAGIDVDVAYFDQICRLSQPTASCLDDCAAREEQRNLTSVARSLIEFLCVDRVQTAKTNPTCLKSSLFRRSKFCVTKCNKLETKLQQSSQVFVVSGGTADLKQGLARNVCKYTKCIAACFMPSVGSNCGRETAVITKDMIAKGMEAFRQAFNLVGEEATACTLDNSVE